MSVEAAQRWAKETTEEQIRVGSWLWKEPLSLGSKGRSRVGERSSKVVCGEQPTAGCEAGDPYPCLLSGPETVGTAGDAAWSITTSLVAPGKEGPQSLAEHSGSRTEVEP